MKQLVILLAVSLTAVLCPAQILQGNLNPSTKVQSINPACGCVTVLDATSFHVGDRVLLIQMQGSSVSADNNESFGYPGRLASAGFAELNTVSSINAQQVGLVFALQQNYDTQNGSVQLVRVVSGSDLHIQSLRADVWNGTNGGVIVVEASHSVVVDGVLDAGGCGFRGGVSVMGSYNCGVHNYYVSATSPDGAPKGEGVSANTLSLRGRGAWANGGGGGNNHNAGGGGGSLAMQGGFGGYAWGNCAIRNDSATRGIGGYALDLRAASPRFYLGGGGGAGHRNDNNPSSGANGGGIIIVVSPSLTVNGGALLCSGMNAQRCEMDGAGGGGAGGTVVLACDEFHGQFTVDVRGGNGGDARNPHGPGGGGSGGVCYVKSAILPSSIQCLGQGGAAGSNYELGGAAVGFVPTHYGATDGGNGAIVTSAQLFAGTTLLNNGLTLDLGPDHNRCHANPEQLQAQCSGGHAPYSYTWSPASMVDNATSATPIFNANESCTLRCTVRDAAGCTAVDSVRITVAPAMVLTMPDSLIMCSGSTCLIDPQLYASSATVHVEWSPKSGLNSTTSLQVICSAEKTTTYYLRVRSDEGCELVDSITVLVSAQQKARIHGDTVVCAGSEQTYSVDLPSAQALLWSVQGCVSLTIDPNQHAIHVLWGSGKSASIQVAAEASQASCINGDAISIRIVPQPVPTMQQSTKTMCEGESVVLDAGDFARYEWSTGDTTRSIRVSAEGIYSVVVKNEAGCESASCSTRVNVIQKPNPQIRQTANDNPCTASTVTLDAGSFSTYLWSTGQTSRTIQVSHDGQYSVVVSNASGCSAESAPVQVHVGPARVPGLDGAGNVCAHSAETYRAAGLSDSYFSWMVDGAEDVTYMGVHNDSVVVVWSNRSSTGQVRVREVTSAGCTVQQSFNVAIEVLAKPEIQCEHPVISSGQTTIVRGPSGYASYLWSTGETTKDISVAKECTVSLVVTNAHGCTEQSDALHISMRSSEQAQVLASALEACEGQSLILQASIPNQEILWNTGAADAIINVSSAGEYYYTVRYTDGTTQNSDTVRIRFEALPDSVLSREGLLLRAPQAASYQWSLNGRSIPGATAQTYMIAEEGLYQVYCTNNLGCGRWSQIYRYQQVNHVHVTIPTVHGAAGSTSDLLIKVTLDGVDPLSIPVGMRLQCSTRASLVHVLDPMATVHYSGDTLYWTFDVHCASSTEAHLPVELLLSDSTSADVSVRMLSSSDSVELNSAPGQIVIDGQCGRSAAKTVSNSTSLEIANIYPNPSTEYADVSYSLCESGHTTLSLYGSDGRVIATLIDGSMDRGHHDLRIDTSQLHSGDYLLVLEAPSRTTKRMFNVVH